MPRIWLRLVGFWTLLLTLLVAAHWLGREEPILARLDANDDGVLNDHDGIDTNASLDDFGGPVSLRWDNLSLRRGDEYIVRPCSGELRARSLMAVMGGSGSGKSTLLRALRGSLDEAESRDGSILVNEVEIDDLSLMGGLVGFVPQDDIVLDELTVEQNLIFSADWRLPEDSFPPEKRRGLVNNVLHHLGMLQQRTLRVGRGSDTKKSHISGGQKKRVNIGAELVSDPSVLFLDEPTSGLDSATTLQIVDMLREVARNSSVAVAAVIHQPSDKVFERFDSLLLMVKGGSTIFMGDAADAVPYFTERGFAEHAKTYANPADFLMDIVGDVIQPSCPADGAACPHYDYLETPYVWWRQHEAARETAEAGAASSPSASSSSATAAAAAVEKSESSAWRTRHVTFAQQYWVLLRRSLFLMYVTFEPRQLGVIVLIAAMIAVARAKVMTSHGANLFSAVVGNRFLALGASLITIVISIPIYAQELLFFERERLVGLNVHAYFAAKWTSGLFMLALMPLAFVAAYVAVLWLQVPRATAPPAVAATAAATTAAAAAAMGGGGSLGGRLLPRSVASVEALATLYWMVAVNGFVANAYATLITLTAGVEQAMLCSVMLILFVSLAGAVHPRLAELSFLEGFFLWVLAHDASVGTLAEASASERPFLQRLSATHRELMAKGIEPVEAAQRALQRAAPARVLAAKLHKAAVETRKIDGTVWHAVERFVPILKSEGSILTEHGVSRQENACERALLCTGLLVHTMAWAHLSHSWGALGALVCVFIVCWLAPPARLFRCGTRRVASAEEVEELNELIAFLAAMSQDPSGTNGTTEAGAAPEATEADARTRSRPSARRKSRSPARGGRARAS